ncbi:hypothetical protein OS122_30170 [Mycolicibacterium mucogenicum]|uniref:hypothetical protein n=1 Tax=Mycolicibacterium mucogenicum TaxID=56689 RepID=UPI00226A8F78|nr:hypothetical protein [Mycolicibacterium mucogenicum]MCX8565153.1 hypothetical protein [Mycolicibacterium mucogenicum]
MKIFSTTRQTVGRFVVAGSLVAITLVTPPAMAMITTDSIASASGNNATSGATPNGGNGVGQLGWIYGVQPHVYVPHVDTTVHQSR